MKPRSWNSEFSSHYRRLTGETPTQTDISAAKEWWAARGRARRGEFVFLIHPVAEACAAADERAGR